MIILIFLRLRHQLLRNFAVAKRKYNTALELVCFIKPEFIALQTRLVEAFFIFVILQQNKKPDTDRDTCRIKTGVRIWQQLIKMIRFQKVSFGFTQNETIARKVQPCKITITTIVL